MNKENNTIKMFYQFKGLYCYAVEYDYYSDTYVIVSTNNPRFYSSQ